MQLRLFFLFIAMILTLHVSAQDSFSEKELISFVEIYMDYKTDRKRITVVDSALFVNHNVTPERYREIANNLYAFKPIKMKDNEEDLMKALDKLQDDVDLERERTLANLCLTHKLSMDIYSNILSHYKTDITFQRSLKPYFVDYVKRHK